MTTYAVTDLLGSAGDLEELAGVGVLLADLDDGDSALEGLLERLVVVLEARASARRETMAGLAMSGVWPDLALGKKLASSDEIKGVVDLRNHVSE